MAGDIGMDGGEIKRVLSWRHTRGPTALWFRVWPCPVAAVDSVPTTYGLRERNHGIEENR